MRYVYFPAYFIALGLSSLLAGTQVSEAKEVAPKSIHEGMFVELNGVHQWITIRGNDVRNPVLLVLHGGPGFPTSELAPAFALFERDYTLVQWDQPGGGANIRQKHGQSHWPTHHWPKNVLSRAAVVQTRMRVDAKSRLLQSGDFLPVGEIAKLAGYREKNPGAQPNRWKRDRAIFAIRHKGVDYFPLYVLNPDEDYRPYNAVAEVLRVFADSQTGWGTAFWFAGLNSFLDDRRPQDLLAVDPALVIAAARDEVEGVRHG